MFGPFAWLLYGIGVAVGLLCHPVAAQLYDKPRPISNVGGYAGTEMRSIYRNDIGQGYSGQSLNQLALNRAQASIPNVGQVSTPHGRIGLGLQSSPANKPFASYSPSPTVSPWLNLFREDLDGSSDLNYQTLVRPQLQQQQFNQQLERRGLEISQRLQQLSASPDFNPQGSRTQLGTGHQTVFMYFGHYYPAPERRQRR